MHTYTNFNKNLPRVGGMSGTGKPISMLASICASLVCVLLLPQMLGWCVVSSLLWRKSLPLMPLVAAVAVLTKERVVDNTVAIFCGPLQQDLDDYSYLIRIRGDKVDIIVRFCFIHRFLIGEYVSNDYGRK